MKMSPREEVSYRYIFLATTDRLGGILREISGELVDRISFAIATQCHVIAHYWSRIKTSFGNL